VVEQLLQEPRLVEAPAPVLAERRGIPQILVDIDPKDTPQRHVALQLPNQIPLARGAEQGAAHQGQEQLLGGDRRPADGRAQVSVGASDRRFLNERPNRAQEMLLWDAGFQRQQLVEERPLRIRVPSSVGSSLLAASGTSRRVEPESSYAIHFVSTLLAL